ncbi:transcription termination/antitermination protein NusA [Candidatus Uhrbacteria bacterium]|nr:transcription termination/antitermination protein NusA [Candidatus Uhrbacteria bacterium]
MASPIVQAIKQICEEKGLSYESVLQTVESALAAAYRKDFGTKNQNIKVEFDPETGSMRAFDLKSVVRDFSEEELEEMKKSEGEGRLGGGDSAIQGSSADLPRTEPLGDLLRTRVRAPGEEQASNSRGAPARPAIIPEIVEGQAKAGLREGSPQASPQLGAGSGAGALPELPHPAAEPSLLGEEKKEEEKEHFNPKTMMMLTPAREIKSDAALGEELRLELEIPHAFGRMAAQTAKQVITQKLREAERATIFDEWSGKQGTIVIGVVGRREGRLQFVDFGRTAAIIPPGEQVERESYRAGERMKFYVKSVAMGSRGPEIVLSRADSQLVAELFRLEIPEAQAGVVEVKAVAREAGGRSKVAVISHDENIDPIGSCIGQRGGRIQTIIAELGGEKIDVIQWEEDAERFIVAALSPAKVKKVELNEQIREANVTVAEQELSLAIGRGGQNVRLASRLTGWKINILGEKGEVVADSEAVEEVPAQEAGVAELSVESIKKEEEANPKSE